MKEPTWLTRQIVEFIHFEQILESGGSHGIRADYTLESALARPQGKYSYSDDADLGLCAAAYGFGLVQGHPFIDGNKRAGFMAMYIFLGLNGYELKASEAEAVGIMFDLAQGAMSEEDLASWLRARMVPEERE